jgi:hypothetical protein
MTYDIFPTLSLTVIVQAILSVKLVIVADTLDEPATVAVGVTVPEVAIIDANLEPVSPAEMVTELTEAAVVATLVVMDNVGTVVSAVGITATPVDDTLPALSTAYTVYVEPQVMAASVGIGDEPVLLKL